MKTLKCWKPCAALTFLLILSATSAAAQQLYFGVVCPNGGPPPGFPPAKPTLLAFQNADLSRVDRLAPIGRGFRKAVRCALADFNADGIDDIVFGTGPGAANQIQIVDGTTSAPFQNRLGSFVPFEAAFKGGVNVAAGDLNNDDVPDVIAAAGKTSSLVSVFDGLTGQVLSSFVAYDPAYTGGVRVAAGDVNGDGIVDLITGPASDPTASNVKVFNGKNNNPLRSFAAYDAGLKGGVYVAAGDVDGDGKADIITGAGAGSGPHVKVFSGADNSLLRSFFAFDSGFKGGVSVSAADVNGDGKADIITGTGKKKSEVRIYDAESAIEIGRIAAYRKYFRGGVSFGQKAPLPEEPGPDELPVDAVSFLDAFPIVDITDFELAVIEDNCGFGVDSFIATFSTSQLDFSNVPDNNNVRFTLQSPGVYSTNNITIIGNRHTGDLTADGCDVTMDFENPRSSEICQAVFHFDPIGTAAEELLTSEAFPTCP